MLALTLVAIASAYACAGTATPAPTASLLPVAPAATAGSPERPTGPTETASLVRAVDGDTIRVIVDGVEERVRYIGIDTPELNPGSAATPEPYAEAATAANARLLSEGRLVLEQDVSERDRYGRLLRDVWVEEAGTWTLVNLALVAEGYAQVSTYPPDVRYVDDLLAAQAEARAASRGLWGEPAP
jgi:micrococcal nuclease